MLKRKELFAFPTWALIWVMWASAEDFQSEEVYTPNAPRRNPSNMKPHVISHGFWGAVPSAGDLLGSMEGTQLGAPESMKLPEGPLKGVLESARNSIHHQHNGPDMPMPEDPQELPAGHHLNNYPNPFVDAHSCNRRGAGVSYVCDPDALLRVDEADWLDEQLAEQRLGSPHQCGKTGNVPYLMVLALTNRLPPGFTAVEMADALLDKWQFGHKNCNDSVLILHINHPRNIVIRWQSGVDDVLTPRKVYAIENQLQRDFNILSLGSTLDRAINAIGLHLSRQVGPPRRKIQLLVMMAISAITFLSYGACAIQMVQSLVPPGEKGARYDERLKRRFAQAQRKLTRIQNMIRDDRLNPRLCPLTLKTLSGPSDDVVVSRFGYHYDANALRGWAERRNISTANADPIHDEVIAADSTPQAAQFVFQVSKIQNLPETLKFIPLRLYLQTLVAQYPELIQQNDVERWLRDRHAKWRVPQPKQT